LTVFKDNKWSVNIGGDLDKQVDQHVSYFHDDFLITILKVIRTRLDKRVRDVCCHHIAFLVCIDGHSDEDAFGGGRRTGGFLFGKVRSGLGTFVDATAFDSAVFLFTKEHHAIAACVFFFSRGVSLDR